MIGLNMREFDGYFYAAWKKRDTVDGASSQDISSMVSDDVASEVCVRVCLGRTRLFVRI